MTLLCIGGRENRYKTYHGQSSELLYLLDSRGGPLLERSTEYTLVEMDSVLASDDIGKSGSPRLRSFRRCHFCIFTLEKSVPNFELLVRGGISAGIVLLVNAPRMLFGR
jgi:hypothetical protein